MARARTVFWLQAALAVLAATVVAIALKGLLATSTAARPSAPELAEACARFVLPDVGLTSVASLALRSVAVAVLLLGARSAVSQLRASRRFLRRLDRLVAPGGPGGARVFVGRAPQAFCAGLVRPRVYLSSGALTTLSRAELDAVLAHEGHHARLRDPLRILFARVLADALFFLPGVQQLAERYGALAEVAADEAAVRASGDPAPLASALLRLEGADPAVLGIAPERVDGLLGESPGWGLPGVLLAWTLVVLSAVGALTLRLNDAAAHSGLSLPLLAAQTCMLLMALGPIVLGAAGVLGMGRIFGAGRRC